MPDLAATPPPPAHEQHPRGKPMGNTPAAVSPIVQHKPACRTAPTALVTYYVTSPGDHTRGTRSGQGQAHQMTLSRNT